MKIEKFIKHINGKNIYDPCDCFLKETAQRIKINAELLMPAGAKPLLCKSYSESDYANHHIFSKDLFPIIGKYGRGTLVIKCSKNKHTEFHTVLAQCLSSGNFVKYELLIKNECPAITADISKIYSSRIAQLHVNYILYVLYQKLKQFTRFFN